MLLFYWYDSRFNLYLIEIDSVALFAVAAAVVVVVVVVVTVNAV